MNLPACIHRGDEVEADRFACGTDRLVHSGTVSGNFCRNRCHVVDKPLRNPSGLGDTIHKVTHALGIKPCGGCKGRKNLLNELVPYSAKE